METSGLPYFIAFARLGLTSLSYIREPLRRLGSAEAIWRADKAQLLAAGLRPGLTRDLIEGRGEVDIETELQLLEKHGISAILHGDPAYPPLLLQIPDPPPVLFVRGNLAALTSLLPFAIVGTRKITGYGEAVAKLFAGQLAAAGMTIVSGLALGIDAACHKATLESGGQTIAVLGSGIDDDSIGPRANLGLARSILEENGAIISEHPPGTNGLPHFYPLRNRIIAGMSLGTLVVEAALKSGALITGRLALDYNRDVYAVPGPITSSQSAGPNTLIKSGAIPALTPEEILTAYHVAKGADDTNNEDRSTEEKMIIKALTDGTISIDAIAEKTNLEPGVILSTITMLEIEGVINKKGAEYTLIKA